MEKLDSNPCQVVQIEADIFELVERFLVAKKKEVECLAAAIDAKDFEAIELFAHRIKGVGKMYGFPAVTDIGQRLEIAAKEKNHTNAKAELAAMYLYLCEVKIMKKVFA